MAPFCKKKKEKKKRKKKKNEAKYSLVLMHLQLTTQIYVAICIMLNNKEFINHFRELKLLSEN